jgi:hypothetical protein
MRYRYAVDAKASCRIGVVHWGGLTDGSAAIEVFHRRSANTTLDLKGVFQPASIQGFQRPL